MSMKSQIYLHRAVQIQQEHSCMMGKVKKAELQAEIFWYSSATANRIIKSPAETKAEPVEFTTASSINAVVKNKALLAYV